MIYTVEDIAKKTGLSAQGVGHRMKARAKKLGPYRQIRGVYVFTETQFQKLCESWGLGQHAVRLHAAGRENAAEQPARRRKAS